MSWIASTQFIYNLTTWISFWTFEGFVTQPLLVTCVTLQVGQLSYRLLYCQILSYYQYRTKNLNVFKYNSTKL